MNPVSENNKEKQLKPYIIAAAIAIPVVVTILAFMPRMDILGGMDPYLLPLFNAIINGTTFLLLLAALMAIKNRNIVLHKRLMTTAIALSLVFLVCYVLFHASTEPTKFGGEGRIRSVYFFLLLTHILLAIVIVPLVLITYVRAIAEKFDKHRKIARITLPIWLYVTLTGVIVYLMIAPYYPH
jgi:putative membrane protein